MKMSVMMRCTRSLGEAAWTDGERWGGGEEEGEPVAGVRGRVTRWGKVRTGCSSLSVIDEPGPSGARQLAVGTASQWGACWTDEFVSAFASCVA